MANPFKGILELSTILNKAATIPKPHLGLAGIGDPGFLGGGGRGERESALTMRHLFFPPVLPPLGQEINGRDIYRIY